MSTSRNLAPRRRIERSPRRYRATALLAAILALGVSLRVVADHPLPGPHFLRCEQQGPAEVLLSWDILDTDPAIHFAHLFANGVRIAELAPGETSFLHETSEFGTIQYRLDIGLLAEPQAEPIARRLCELELPGMSCEVFGGIAQPPQLVIFWVLPAPDADRIDIFRDDELWAMLDGGTIEWTTEPEQGTFTWRVEARYEDAIAIVGECEATFDPPVIGGLQRADCNGDGNHDLSDGVCILSYLFLGGEARCLQAADVDDDASIDLSDAVFFLNHLFLGGPAPAAPFPDCGHDTTPDELGCAEHSPCFNPPPP